MPGPFIGVSTSVGVGQSPERAFVNAAYVRAVQAAGGVPVLLPPQLDGRARRELYPFLHGVLLTGGADIDPALFGEEPHPTVYDVSAERDGLEIELVTRAMEADLPLFAICRGVQVLNVALGGSLWQDIPAQLDSPITHSQKAPRAEPTHRVSLDPESRLARITGRTELDVNSFHHQALRKLGAGLRPVAWAGDEVVEAVELPDASAPVFGVQWHPEDLVERDAAALALFRALVAAAEARASRR